MTIDQYSDPAFGLLLKHVTAMPGLESFVKEASIDSKEAQELPTSAFAWPDQRKFPIHSAEHAALSYAYYKVASTRVPPDVGETLKQALELYGVPMTVFETVKVATAPDTSEQDFLLPDLKLMPVKTAAEAKLAQNTLLDNFTKLDISHRAMAAGNLVKKADAFGFAVAAPILKLAGLTTCDTRVAEDWLEARAEATPISQPLVKQAYRTLAREVSQHPREVRDRAGLLKLANAVAELDEKSGLDRHYDRKIPDALQTFFNTEKVAADTLDIAGKLVTLKKLASLPETFWSDLVDGDFAKEAFPNGTLDSAKLAVLVETLPLDLKVALKAYC